MGPSLRAERPERACHAAACFNARSENQRTESHTQSGDDQKHAYAQTSAAYGKTILALSLTKTKAYA